MYLSTRKIKSYRQSLKLFMGYRREDNWAMEFHAPAWKVLGELLLNQQGTLDHFLSRYPKCQRERRKLEVKQVVALWLAELAGGLHD